MRYISSMKLRLQQVEISTDLANNTCANRTNQMLSLVCVFLFIVEQSQFFSWCGIWRIKGICMRVSKGGGGGRGPDHPPGKSHKYSNTGPDPSKNHKKYEASIQCWAIIDTPAKRHLNGASLACQRWPAYSGIWILSPLNNQKKETGLLVD